MGRFLAAEQEQRRERCRAETFHKRGSGGPASKPSSSGHGTKTVLKGTSHGRPLLESSPDIHIRTDFNGRI